MNIVRYALVKVLAMVGLLTVLLVVGGVWLDYRTFDSTKGGYSPPYQNYTGHPIDWELLDTTSEGMVYRGFVLDVLVNCRSGMVSFETYRYRFDWRPLSPRALAIHKPKAACQQRGFMPNF